ISKEDRTTEVAVETLEDQGATQVLVQIDKSPVQFRRSYRVSRQPDRLVITWKKRSCVEI
ncbi:hypothetical protein SK128_026207, partial [Halocaridina rubra]